VKNLLTIGMLCGLLSVGIGCKHGFTDKAAVTCENCRGLLIGMNKTQVNVKMGSPETTVKDDDYQGISFWVYKAEIVGAAPVEIAIDDASGRVAQIVCCGAAITKTIDGDDLPADYLKKRRGSLRSRP
jgi:hypothetical protein